MKRPTVISCRVFGGRSPLTGKPVGERHRWDGGAWGVGRCEFCGHTLDEVLQKPKQGLSLEQAIEAGITQEDEAGWRPSWEPGQYGVTKGWYIRRKAVGHWGFEWMRDARGNALRLDTKEDALTAIAVAAAEDESRNRNQSMTLKVLACEVDGVNSEDSVEDLDAALALAKAKRNQRHHRVEILDGDLTTHRWDRTHVVGENRWRKVNPGEMRLLGPVPAIVRVARRQVAV